MRGGSVQITQETICRLRSARRVTVLTGAGVSAESGVPTFRGPGGLWRGALAAGGGLVRRGVAGGGAQRGSPPLRTLRADDRRGDLEHRPPRGIPAAHGPAGRRLDHRGESGVDPPQPARGRVAETSRWDDRSPTGRGSVGRESRVKLLYLD